MDRAKLEELRRRMYGAMPGWFGPSPVPRMVQKDDLDALFAHIDELERENRKMMEALEEP